MPIKQFIYKIQGLQASNTTNENLKRIIYASKNKPTPATSSSITDMLCFSFEVCVSLFLFRSSLLLIHYSHNELNRKAYKLIKSKQASKIHQPAIHDKLIRLKQEFFKLISLMLNSINFSTTAMNFSKSYQDFNQTQVTCDSLSSLSSLSTPYSTLKILNNILDCLNYLIYLPVLAQQSDPNSITTWFYFR